MFVRIVGYCMIRALGDKVPTIAESAYVDENATVIGDVELGEKASVWPGAVLRADGGSITVRDGANVQDNVVFHADAPDKQVLVEERATVGHSAVVHNATVGRESLIGMNAVVLDDAEIEEYSVVAAGSVVTESQTVPDHSLVAGTPAEVLREGLSESAGFFEGGEEYVELAATYREESRIVSRGEGGD